MWDTLIYLPIRYWKKLNNTFNVIKILKRRSIITIIKEIYDFIIKTNYDDLPDKSIETAKLAYLDTLSVSIAGLKSNEMRILIEDITKENGKSFLEIENNLKDEDFSLLLGTLSHVIDYDDVNFTFHGHPSVSLIPPILTYAKYIRAINGRELILSYLIGFEVQARIGEDIGDLQYNKGFHTTSTLGIFGAASSLAKLMNLSFNEFSNLLGMCTSFSSGTRKNFGTMTKPLHVGLLSRNVYFFSKLVKRGFTANKNSFAEPMSFAHITTGEHNKLKSLKKLGKIWESDDFGIIIKKYPCCAYTHRSIDGIIKLLETKELQSDSIKKVIAEVNPKVEKVLIYPNATTIAEGKFSMQYCLAAAIINGKVNLETFTKENLENNSIRKMMDKIEMKVDKDQKDTGKETRAVINVYTDNTKYQVTIEHPLGHPYNPLTINQIKEKVNDCVDSFISKTKKKKLINTCRDLPTYSSNELLDILIQEEG